MTRASARGGDRARWEARRGAANGARPPPWGLATGILVLLAGGVFVFWVGEGLTFLQDEWSFVTGRLGSGAETYLDPVNEHLMAVPVGVFKALFVTAGLGNYWAYRLVLTVVHLVCVALLWVLASRRVGPVLAGMIAAPILVFGASSPVVLFPINLGFLGSLVAGLGALVCLDARARWAWPAACPLLCLSVASSGVGVAFALGVLVEVLFSRNRWRRVWIAAIPLTLYAIWYLQYNPQRSGPWKYGEAPSFAVRVGAAAVDGLFGAPQFEMSGELSTWAERFGLLAVVTGAVGLAWVVTVNRRLSPRLAMLITTLAFFWGSLGLARAYTGSPGAPRYIYPGAVLILLIAVEVAQSFVIPQVVIVVIGLLALVSTALNAHWLAKNGDRRRMESQLVTAELGAVEVARGEVADDFQPIQGPGYPPFTAGSYFRAMDSLPGSVGMSPADLQRAPDWARAAADDVLIRATVRTVPDSPAVRRFLGAAGGNAPREQPRLRPRSSGARLFVEARGCLLVRPLPTDRATLRVNPPRPGLLVAPAGNPPPRVRLRRFAPDFSDPRSLLPAVHSAHFLVAPLGNAKLPWRAQISGSAPFRVC